MKYTIENDEEHANALEFIKLHFHKEPKDMPPEFDSIVDAVVKYERVRWPMDEEPIE